MLVVPTEHITMDGKIVVPGALPVSLGVQQLNSAYCGLDCCMTVEIHEAQEALKASTIHRGDRGPRTGRRWPQSDFVPCQCT